jgi:hypothetical protein
MPLFVDGFLRRGGSRFKILSGTANSVAGSSERDAAQGNGDESFAEHQVILV